jgi:hypothetical protein
MTSLLALKFKLPSCSLENVLFLSLFVITAIQCNMYWPPTRPSSQLAHRLIYISMGPTSVMLYCWYNYISTYNTVIHKVRFMTCIRLALFFRALKNYKDSCVVRSYISLLPRKLGNLKYSIFYFCFLAPCT